MSISTVIKKLRLKKGITQEELARRLNISTQAVSKWENGGSPDIEIVPSIAEYFDVSIDYLFERKKVYSKDIERDIFNYLNEIKDDKERYYKILDLTFLMSVFSRGDEIANRDEIDELLAKKGNFHSMVVDKSGFSITSFNSALPFSLCFPLPKNGSYDYCYKNQEKHLEFIKDLSNKDYYDALIFLNKRDSTNFTESLLINELKISNEQSKEIINSLLKYRFIEQETLCIDDKTVIIYKLLKSPIIVAFLASLELIVVL